MIQKRNNASGFTLLEVMVAFIIASLAAVALYRAGFDGVNEALIAARLQEALVRAESHLAAIGNLTRLQDEQQSGDDGGGFHWDIRISSGPQTGTLVLYDVIVRESFGARSVILATKRLGPA